MSDPDLDDVLAHIEVTIGSNPTTWPPPPDGYPQEVEAALLDAVFSLQANYGQRTGPTGPTGAYKVVDNWRRRVQRPLNSLCQLVRDVDDERICGDTDRFPGVLDNRQVALPSAADKPTKALAAYVVAKTLCSMRIDTADDVIEAAAERPKELVRAIKKARGVGPAAATYFLMNLKVPGVKVDTMVHRFVCAALNRKVSFQLAGALVTEAADRLGGDDLLLHLDHTIWNHESHAARERRRRRGCKSVASEAARARVTIRSPGGAPSM